jgi:mRNA-degrading endonuclease RelE of RelBE toxin-antitoxin system
VCALGSEVESGYNLARMRHEIVLAPEAQQAFRDLPARVRSQVRDALEVHLRFEPTRVSRSRIKRLRGVSRPQYRLRVGDIRVFYDVTEATVEILAIITKAEAQAWLDAEGSPTRERGPG